MCPRTASNCQFAAHEYGSHFGSVGDSPDGVSVWEGIVPTSVIPGTMTLTRAESNSRACFEINESGFLITRSA
ncbi:MAG: hypothetical protein CMJ48_10825 [Planctomycetaceae bacterium]|nr:hypothetical protein [Planctomycetaceae bacterium]